MNKNKWTKKLVLMAIFAMFTAAAGVSTTGIYTNQFNSNDLSLDNTKNANIFRDEEQYYVDALEAITNQLRFINLDDPNNPQINSWVQWQEISDSIIKHSNAILQFEDFLLNSFAQNSNNLTASQIAQNEQVKQQIIDEFRKFDVLFSNLETSHNNGNQQDQKTDLVNLAKFMQNKSASKSYQALTPKNIKSKSTSLRGVLKDKQKLLNWLNSKQTKLKAQNIKAATDSIYLQPTTEIQITPRIQTLATSLNNNPIEIYNWVKSTINYQPTFGALQGSDLTLMNLQANAFDTSSLLIVLLRDSGIPSRYAYGVIEVPIDRLINWLQVDSAENAVSLLSQGGIPAGIVVNAGQITAVQMEHVWVEAWLDFIPSRGVKNIQGDTWVSLDASFKQHQFTPAVDLSTYATFDMNGVISQLDQTATHGQFGSITNVDTEYLRKSINDYIDQVVPALDADYPNITVEEITNRYSIIPTNRTNLPASLQNKVVTLAQTYSALPMGLIHQLSVKMYASNLDISLNAPSLDFSISLPELALSTLSINYAPASVTDQQKLDAIISNNASSFAPYQINVKPQIQINGVTQIEAGAKTMGQTEYWTTAIIDPNNLNSAPTEPFQFTTGSQIVLAVDASGLSPQALESHNAQIQNFGSGHIRNALHQAGLNYFVGHDLMDQLFAKQVNGRALRMPSIGAFFAPLSVRYMFGIPRSANMSNYETDIKRIATAIVAPDAEKRLSFAAQSGSTGSALEGMVWEMLFNKPLGSSAVSAVAILHHANTRGVPVHTITQANLADVMPLLQLSADAEQEIYNSVQAGYEVITPEYEFNLGEFQGTGYIIRNPYTGTALYRLEGGTNGAALVGCIAKAILLNVVFDKILAKIWPKIAAAAVATFGVLAILGPAGVLLGTVAAFASNIYFMASFMAATLEFTMMLATVSIEKILVKYGIQAAINAACSSVSPCRGKKKGKNGKPGKKKCRKGLCRLTSLFGNPVDVVSGAKYQYQTDYESSSDSNLNFTRLYYSSTQFNSPTGIQWRHNYDKTLILGDSLNHPWPQNLLLVTEDGSWYQFQRGGTLGKSYYPRTDVTYQLQALGSDQAAPTGYRITNDDDEIETYNSEGRLVSIKSLSGITQTLSYNTDGNLIAVTDSFGHQMTFQYDASTKLLTTMIDPAQQQYTYHHDVFGNLTQVDYPDSTSLQYHYEDNSLPHALTGITNEKSIRLSTYVYNIDGRVTDTYLSGDTYHYHFQYGTLQTIMTDPLGKIRTYQYQYINEQNRLVAVDQICSSCGGGGASQQIWNTQGSLTDQIDFNGNRTSFSYNDRGLETSLTQAKDTPQERTITTTWNPNFSEPDTITEPSASSGNKVTTFTYDANGNMLTKTITADAKSRTWTYTYNNYGQMLTQDEPRTDVNDITTWTYDASGNKRTMTNALGHVTQWDNFNAHGQAGTMTNSNNIVTTYTYDELTRLTQSETAGEITQYAYTPTGNLDKLILPDNSYLQYGYDNADRLMNIQDNLGNKIVYTLDNAGNRTSEKTYNDSNALVQTLTNVYNDLGQLQNSIGADNQTTTWSYDGNGNEKTQSDPLLHVTGSDYDALNRLSQITDPDLNSIKYDYDKQDNLTQVTDPRNLATTYTYNGFNEQTKLTSPDTGITNFSYDQASNLINKTDARGQNAQYSYDAINRIKTITYSDETITFDYDSGTNAKGRLNQVTDNSGQTSYTYDNHGRVDVKTQTTNSINLTDNYDYNAEGQLTKLTTPSGVEITYSYRADGRVTTISVNGVEITRSIQYFAFGEPESWNYGNNYDYQRTFDSDGRVETYTQGNDIQTLAYDPASRITALTDTSNAWDFSYDNLDRLATADKTDTSLIWDYDPTGNRLFEKLNGVQTDYATDTISNKLAQLGTTTRTYDAVGNLQDNGAITSTYSGRNRLISTQSTLAPTLYEYNAFGERVSKQSATQTLFIYDEEAHLLGEYGPNGGLISETIWLDDTPIATIRPTTEMHNGLVAGSVKVFFIQPDHLDSPRTVVDNSNQVIWQWHSDPFGKELANQDVDGNSAGFIYYLRFPGQYFDVETNTHYNYFRDYQPETGRYLQSDPIGLEGSINTYNYVDNEVLDAIDEYGLAKFKKKPKKDKTFCNPNKRSYSRKERKVLFEDSKNDKGIPKCFYCATETTMEFGFPNSMEADHYDPWDKGGKTTKKNGKSSCRTCNRRKSNKSVGTGPNDFTPSVKR